MEEIKKIGESEKSEHAKSRRDVAHQGLEFCIRRVAELADEFTRLEVQIATILFAFGGIFLNYFNLPSKNFSPNEIFLMKIEFVFIIIFLIGSLSLGLLHLKRKEQFWVESLKQRSARYRKWDSVVAGKNSYEEGMSYQEGTSVEKNIISTPAWSWILQTICLGFAILLIFILFVVFLFHN